MFSQCKLFKTGVMCSLRGDFVNIRATLIGVKQGGCLSPTLFSIYLNDLIDVSRFSNIGCRYGNHYMGVYCYADDIGLLSLTLSGLKEMLKLCEDYALKHKIILIASKSKLFLFPIKHSQSAKRLAVKNEERASNTI